MAHLRRFAQVPLLLMVSPHGFDSPVLPFLAADGFRGVLECPSLVRLGRPHLAIFAA